MLTAWWKVDPHHHQQLSVPSNTREPKEASKSSWKSISASTIMLFTFNWIEGSVTTMYLEFELDLVGLVDITV